MAVHLAQWRSARAVRAVAMCWCQDDVEGYAGATPMSSVFVSRPPPLSRRRTLQGQDKHAFSGLVTKGVGQVG